MTQEFFIQTIPQAQARARFARMGNFVKTYDPAKCKDYKSDLKWQIIEQHPKKIIGPITMVVDFLMPRPKNHFGAKGLKATAPIFHTTRPDVDNCIKALMDCAKGILWDDDTQVAVLVATKKYSEITGIRILIQEAV